MTHIVDNQRQSTTATRMTVRVTRHRGPIDQGSWLVTIAEPCNLVSFRLFPSIESALAFASDVLQISSAQEVSNG